MVFVDIDESKRVHTATSAIEILVRTMGNEQSTNTIDFEKPEEWSLDQVRSLYKLFIDGCYDFGVDERTFDEFMREALPAATNSPTFLWERFDTGQSGLVNILEAMTGLAVVCAAPINDKIDFIFDMHDLSQTGSLNYDEAVVVICIIVSSMVLISCQGDLPEETAMESIVDGAFTDLDIEISGQLDKANFSSWVRTFIGVEEKGSAAKGLTLRKCLRRFGVTPSK